jgi:diphosphomevalonate decarboxylase
MCFKKIIQERTNQKYLYLNFIFHVYNKRFYPLLILITIEQGEFPLDCSKQYCFGKILEKDNQIPANPSVSFTLNNCKTITKLAFLKKKNRYFPLICFFEGKPKKISNRKSKFLERIEIYLPFLKTIIYNRHTNVPHSSGIASASGMAALAMNFMSLEKSKS